ncbi:MAG: hypothetical protein ACHQNE_02065 [Candidatus Kapaibacterium sp.]
MTVSLRTLSQVLFACVFFVSLTSGLRAQAHSNSLGTIMWPADPPVGIGTEHDGGALNALHIHYDPSDTSTRAPIIRLSEGSSTSNPLFGILELTPTAHDTTFTSIANQRDLILHENLEGDLILTNWSPDTVTGAIRFATTGDTNARPIPGPGHHDLERMTILGNGNVGIDLPPDSATGFGKPMDQFQLGGSSTLPGLTGYGGNRFEGMPKPGGGTFGVDYRYISFNHYQNHGTGVGGGRFAPLGASGVLFSDDDTNGLLQLEAVPFWPGDSLNDWSGGMTLSLGGHEGLGLYCDERRFGGNQYHHLLDVYPPGVLPYGVTRNVNGLTYIHTPLCVSSDTSGPSLDFTNFLGLYPDIGDGKTWTLVVNGAELAKEIFVLDSIWADYVFMPGYKLMSINDLGNYIESNHHLPGIPSASQVAQTGVPIGRTEAALTKNVEELTLYTIQLSKQNDQLSKQNEELSQRLQKLESEFQELKNQKGK